MTFPEELTRCAEKLRRHGFEAVLARDIDEAGELLRQDLAAHAPAVVSYGDSVTLRATGIIDELRERFPGEFIDGFAPGMPRPERLKERRRALMCDYFMTGINAVSLEGTLHWLDMVGNRIAPVAFGPERVVLLAGKNKIRRTPEEAERRIRETAGPLNIARHPGFATPCAKTGVCMDCSSPDRICNTHLVMERCYPKGRVLVLLVDENLGL